jgi:putative flavoprotein involved in K+ transport
MDSSEPVVIVGAGAAGLAVGGALHKYGIDALLLEKELEIGLPWANRYASLRLNTPRGLSHLPGYRMPRHFGRWPGKDHMVTYLRDYHQRLELRVRFGVDARRIDRDGPDWRVVTSEGTITARSVVVSAGHDAHPVVPDWPGRDVFPGELIHSSAYQEPSSYARKRVLVVSIANSGSEIAFELARGGASHVWASARSAPPIVPREWMGVPLMYTALPLNRWPDRVGDFATGALQRMLYGDLSRHGISRPTHGVQTRARRLHRSTLIDAGFVRAVKAGHIDVVAALERLDGPEAVLADRTRVVPDVVIAATGFRTNLPELVGHLAVLDERGYPAVAQGADAPAAPGLFFSGYWASMIGQLLHMRRDARTIARKISARA